MRASVLRHKCRMNQIMHENYHPPGSTMVRFPLLRLCLAVKNSPVRREFARLLLAIRATGQLRQRYPSYF